METKTITVYVATHKRTELKTTDSCYKLLHVGAANHDDKFDCLCDNVGENISEKNPMYCELTGLYWIWKNADHDKYVGLCHYRRYLVSA